MGQTLATSARALSRALATFSKALEGNDDRLLAYFSKLGWTLPLVPPALRELQSSSVQLVETLARLEDKLRRVPDGSASEDDVNDAAAELLLDFALFASAIRDLPAGLRDQLPPAFVAATAIDEQVHSRLFNDALSRLLEYGSREIDLIARVLGLAESIPRDADPARFQPAFVERQIRWDRLRLLASDPAALARDVYGWGTSSLDTRKLLLALRDLSFVLLAPAFFDYATRALQRAVVPGLPESATRERGLMAPLNTGTPLELSLGLYPVPKLQPDELQGLMFALSGLAGLAESFEIAPGLTLTVQGQLDLAAGVALAFWPDRPARIVGNALAGGMPVDAGHARLTVRYAPAAQNQRVPLLSFSAFRLDAAALSADAAVGVSAESAADAFVEAGLPGLRLEVGNLRSDSFLARVLPETARLEFDIYVGWSLAQGLYWKGSAGAEISIPVSKTIGPVTLDRIDIAFRSTDDTYRLAIGLSATARLGPAALHIEGMGAAVVVDTRGGNLGLVDVSFSAVPPRGFGVAVDTGLVTGGGFLDLDPVTGRYFGALELDVRGIAVKAFGLLETRLPGGVPAYSFVIVVSTEFTPVPLGLGFTLNGVGGLLGIHRRLNVDALRTRMRTGALDHLLFPPSPIENSGGILSDLQTVFPPAENRYVFGPMAIIGWGAPTLFTGKLGILLEIPDPARLVLIGLFQVGIPRPEEAIVELNLDVIGEFDLQRGRFALDGRLRESRVVWFPLEGEIAARMSFAGERNFAVSIGGFNPAYQPPPGFPKLQRVTVPIGADDDPRLTLEGYLAVTSNTLQLGARAAVYASAGWFNILGEVGFNALITRSPLSFETDFSGRVALRKGESVLAGVKLSAKLSGPTPWHAAGEACLEIRWFPDICVGFDATFGEKRRTELPSLDPWPLLRDAVENPESWNGERPANAFRSATLAGPAGLLDPALGVTLRQTVVPLNRTLSRFGAGQPPGGSVRFDVVTVTSNGQSLGPVAPVEDFFAPAQFEALSNDEKLSRPSFEPMAAGITLGRDAIGLGATVGTPVRYETVILDSIFDRRRANPHLPTRDWQIAVSGFSAAALAPVRNSGPLKFTSPETKVLAQMDEERFVVVSTLDLSLRSDVSPPAGKGASFQALGAYLSLHPEERGRLEVVSLDELPGAA